MSSSFSRAATMNRAKSTRRVMLLSRIGSPTCRLHTGRPWLSPSSRSLPRTTVQRVSLAKTRLHASTWSLRSATRARRASGPPIFTSALSFHEYTSCPSRVMCQPHENTRRAPGGAWSSTAWAVPVEYPWTPRGTSTTSTPSHPATARLMTSGSFVAPGTTVIRPLNLSSFPTLCSRHTPTTSYPRSSACCTMYCPSFPEAPTMQTLTASSPWLPRSHFGRSGCGNAVGGLLCMSLDIEVRKPLEPARQVPVPLAEQLHRCGHKHRADERRIDQQRDCDPEPHLLEHHEVACREAREDGDDDQRGARDDARRRADPVRDRVGVVARLRVALADAAEEEHLVVHGQSEEDCEEKERHPRLDHVNLLEAEEAGADALLKDEDEQSVGRADGE